MKTILLFTVFLLYTTTCFAKTITGKITGADDEEVIGATVTVKNSSISTSTNFDGEYSIEAASEDILVISYTEYDSQEILVGNQTIINTKLTSSTLDAVIIMGYRNSYKQKSNIASSTIIARSNTNKAQRLSGRAPGLQIQNTTGQPGAISNIRQRGFTYTPSLNHPMMVLNGKQITSNELQNLNPKDISNVQVLKNTSATTLYGSRGANGVIVINTNGKSKMNETAQFIHQIQDLFMNES